MPGEFAEGGRDPGRGDALDELLLAPAVPDEVGDRDERQAVLGGEPFQLRPSRHRLLVCSDDLAENAGRVAACQAGQVDRGLGMAGALEDAAGPVPERQDVARPGQLARLRARIDEGPDSCGAVAGGDPCRRAGAIVHRHGERRPLRLGVLSHHEGQLELVEPLGHERRADEAGGVGEEEGDPLGGGELSRHHEVALVLTVLVVDHDDHLASGDGGDSLLHGGQRHGASSFSGSESYRAVSGAWSSPRPPAVRLPSGRRLRAA